MNCRKDMIDFSLARMVGFTLEGSSDGDNRSIFSLAKTLIQSASGETLADCRKPLAAVLSLSVRDPREKFHGVKLMLLHQLIETLFGSSHDLLSDREFIGYNRNKLLDYLEICRRIFVSRYTPAVLTAAKTASYTESKLETAMGKAFRLASERGKRRDG